MNKQLLLIAFLLSANCVFYDVTFKFRWNRRNFPVDYPATAHFTDIVGWSHRTTQTYLRPGTLASNGVQQMAEEGFNNPMASELESKVANGEGLKVFSGPSTRTGAENVTIRIEVSEEFSSVTLVTMLAPSPDWYAGCVNQNLLGANGEFQNKVTINGNVYDSGTDSGRSFNSPNVPTRPKQPISMFVSPPLGNGQRLNTQFLEMEFNLVPLEQVEESDDFFGSFEDFAPTTANPPTQNNDNEDFFGNNDDFFGSSESSESDNFNPGQQLPPQINEDFNNNDDFFGNVESTSTESSEDDEFAPGVFTGGNPTGIPNPGNQDFFGQGEESSESSETEDLPIQDFTNTTFPNPGQVNPITNIGNEFESMSSSSETTESIETESSEESFSEVDDSELINDFTGPTIVRPVEPVQPVQPVQPTITISEPEPVVIDNNQVISNNSINQCSAVRGTVCSSQQFTCGFRARQFLRNRFQSNPSASDLQQIQAECTRNPSSCFQAIQNTVNQCDLCGLQGVDTFVVGRCSDVQSSQYSRITRELLRGVRRESSLSNLRETRERISNRLTALIERLTILANRFRDSRPRKAMILERLITRLQTTQSLASNNTSSSSSQSSRLSRAERLRRLREFREMRRIRQMMRNRRN